MSERASTLANTARRLAQRAGRPELAQRISDEAGRWGHSACTVAVVGQIGAGKTQLVNALAGTPGALPVGRGGTAAVTILTSGATFAAEVRRRGLASARAIGPNELVAEITRDGLAGAPAADAVEVALPAPRLIDGLVVLDTPGVNGLDELAARRAIAATRTVDAVVYVIDASSPFTKSELRLLSEVSVRVRSVVVVVTRIDRFRGWRRIITETEPVVNTLPGLGRVRVIGVSSKLADAAFDPSLNDAEAVELLSESGLPELQQHLSDVVRRVRFLRLGNLTATIGLVLDELSLHHEVTVAAGSDDAGAEMIQQAEAARRLLVELRDEGASWLVALSDSITQLREESNADLLRRIGEQSVRFERQIVTWDGDLATFAASVDDDVALVAEEFGETLGIRLSTLVQALAARSDLADLRLAADPTDLLRIASTESADGERTTSEGVRLKVAGSLVSAATSSSMLLTMMGGMGDTLAMVRIGALGAAAVFSGAVAAVTVRADRRNRNRQELRAEFKARADALRSQGPVRVRTFLLSTQRSLEAQIKLLIRDRASVLEGQLATLQSAGRSDLAERRRQAARAGDELRQLDLVRQDLVALSAALDAALTDA